MATTTTPALVVVQREWVDIPGCSTVLICRGTRWVLLGTAHCAGLPIEYGAEVAMMLLEEGDRALGQEPPKVDAAYAYAS